MLVLLLTWDAAALLAQAGAEVKRPSFAGAWKPSDPEHSERLFAVGIGWVPGDGRIVIEQTANRLAVTKHLPEATLDRVLAFQREYYPTVIHRIDEPRGRAGGAGASGQAAGSSWQGERLVLTQRQAGIRHITVLLSLDGDRLKVDNQVVIVGEGKQSTTPEWFERIK
jgi:hypothetical protein